MSIVSFILGVLGNAIAIVSLLSPTPTFWVIFRQKNTDDFSPQPYLFNLLSAMFWTYYGLHKKGGIFLVTINVTSCAFQALYLSLFLCFANRAQRKKTLSILLVILSSYVTIVLTTMKLAHGDRSLDIIGVVCIIASVFSNAAPLSITRMVIKTRTVKYMPFSISLCLFLNGACWLAYALSIKDTLLAIPNGIAVSLGAVQIALYSFFKLYGVQPKVLAETVEDIKPKQCETLKDVEMLAVKNSSSKLAISDASAPLPIVDAVLQEITITT